MEARNKLDLRQIGLGDEPGGVFALVQQLLDNTTDLIAFCNLQHELLYLNDAGLRLTGLDSTAVTLSTIYGLFAPKSHTVLAEQLTLTVERGAFQADLPMLNAATGKMLPMHLTTFLLQPPGGRAPVAYAAVGRDLSELKALVEQLHQAQKMDALGQLAGGIAHDFNNMLTAILGTVDLVTKVSGPAQPDAATLQALERIGRAGKRAASVTRQLLGFSRRSESQPELLDVNDSIAAITQLLQRIIPSNIIISCSLSPDLHRVKIDPGQFEMIITNLILNARDAMPSGGGITITSTNCGDSTSPQVLIDVADNGIGIPKEILSRIFEPFFTTKPVGEGTGLGLASVRGMLDRAGGSIEADSVFGQGTVFHMRLPATTERPAETTTASYNLSFGGSETVLLCEDEELLRSVLRQILTAYGYRVIEAEDAAAALRLLQRPLPRIRLVVADLIMPGTNGIDLADIILALYPDIGVLLISGLAKRSQIAPMLENPAVDFLSKPFALEQFLAKIRALLDAPRPAPAP